MGKVGLSRKSELTIIQAGDVIQFKDGRKFEVKGFATVGQPNRLMVYGKNYTRTDILLEDRIFKVFREGKEV